MTENQRLADRVREELLPFVVKPAQYIGGEFNQPVREGDWAKAEVRLVLAFPDAYEVGMSHLGCQILYWMANQMPGVCAERCYAPWVDAERVMRRSNLPLFTWDTRQPVAEADILAFSLQYEMVFTGMLTMLNLAGVPLRSADRDDRHPLVIVGGPQADNPEPIADFVDLVVIGDGEESLGAILRFYRDLKAGGVRRRDMIELIARQFPWVYAPSGYEPRYQPDGQLSAIIPRLSGMPGEIARCRTEDFNRTPVPLRPLVPHTEIVHDRMAIEIMRGCPQRCRFCHAGFTKRPLRYRSVESILDIAEQQYFATGHSELGLLSLSTGDYPHLRELAEKINERFAPRHVNISMPSLRVDKMLQNIPWMARSVRKSGLTIAVEAGDGRLRDAIRKKVTDGDLLQGVLEAYRAGWRRVKCYFMAGFPGETGEDIRAIYDLSVELSLARKQLGKGPAQISSSVSWLVPKPHTPMQWVAQRRAEYFREVRRRLSGWCRTGPRSVQIKTHDPERSILEAVLARGDRRCSACIERAWRLGARFDGWDEQFRPDLWQQAFADTGVDPDWYAHRERGLDEVLPWDHLRSGPPRSRLEKDYQDMFQRLGQTPPPPGIIA